jgi:hypothetical protein
VTTHSVRTRSVPATEEKRRDQVWRKSSMISPMRSRTDERIGLDLARGLSLLSSMRRIIARWRRCTDRSSRGTSSGKGSSATVRP